MPKRRRLATGIYEDAYGISVLHREAGRNVETRFPRGSDVDRLTAWRETQIRQVKDLTPAAPRKTLARDIVRYLKRLKGLPSYKAEKSHLRAWLQRFPNTPRRSIKREQVELAIAAWREDGYAARTIRHRCRALESVFHRLDGRRAPTPFDEVQLPRKPKPRPVSVSDETIAAVALELRKHEIAKTLRDAKTRARFLVLATTGRRPAEVKRTRREDIDLYRRLWFTRTAKGGLNSAILLNDEMLAAWQLFMAAGAWGWYDDRSFAKTLRRCGWPAGIRPYNLRHSTGRAIRARGGDLEDVQDQLGHASIVTTREFYLHELPARQAAVSARLAGRFSASAFVAASQNEPSQNRQGREAKGRDFARVSKGSRTGQLRESGEGKTTKSA